MSSVPVQATNPEITTPPDETGSTIWRQIKAMMSGRLIIALILVASILIFAFIGPFFLGTGDPMKIVGGLYNEPNSQQWLGTDNFGRDVFTQLMYGTRTSLYIGIVAGVVATVLGVAIGLVAGYYGGWVDELLMGITNVIITIPSIVVLILISIAIGTKSITSMAVIIGIMSWPWTARAVRAQASSVRTREHVDLAKITGASTPSILLWEIMPYMMSYIFMVFVLQMTSGILQEATLSMLGLGPSSSISLGIMLYWALLWESVRTGAWWAFVPTTLMLTVIAFSLYLLQASLDEVFNPRLRRK
ncbi:MAG: ABC transporter permease [Thermomicrobiales bacterium]|nr:ABC transporter permease [Thermomicrobiales bacterium]MCO5219778.1 ABC transporter permease [Thermomicrobiales bacterium]MCO5225246.1 ABC transporter permease [Thermomicrobiales bacterium]MCO5229026.1 ABC transporter permease [Thermomicrobiales bacterium]